MPAWKARALLNALGLHDLAGPQEPLKCVEGQDTCHEWMQTVCRYLVGESNVVSRSKASVSIFVENQRRDGTMSGVRKRRDLLIEWMSRLPCLSGLRLPLARKRSSLRFALAVASAQRLIAQSGDRDEGRGHGFVGVDYRPDDEDCRGRGEWTGASIRVGVPGGGDCDDCLVKLARL